MYWITVDKGEQFHSVIQHLVSEGVFDAGALDRVLVVALSGAESSSVRDAYTGLLSIFNKYRDWSNLVDQSRGQRYIKELS